MTLTIARRKATNKWNHHTDEFHHQLKVPGLRTGSLPSKLCGKGPTEELSHQPALWRQKQELMLQIGEQPTEQTLLNRSVLCDLLKCISHIHGAFYLQWHHLPAISTNRGYTQMTSLGVEWFEGGHTYSTTPEMGVRGERTGCRLLATTRQWSLLFPFQVGCYIYSDLRDYSCRLGPQPNWIRIVTGPFVTMDVARMWFQNQQQRSSTEWPLPLYWFLFWAPKWSPIQYPL